MTSPVAAADSPAPALVDGVDIDAVVTAVRACPAVDDLCSGPWGAVTSYLPGRRVAGVRVAGDQVEISVRSRWDVPVAELAAQVRTALAVLVGSRRLDIVVADVTDAPGMSTPDAVVSPTAGPDEDEVTAWTTSGAGIAPGVSSSGPSTPTGAAIPPPLPPG